MVRIGETLGNLSARSRGSATAEDRGLLRPGRPSSRGLFHAPATTALVPGESPPRPLATRTPLATAAPAARTAAPPARPVQRTSVTPRPLETATPQQRRRAYGSPAGAPAAPPAPAVALGSRCALQGTAHTTKRRADSPAKICSPSRAAAHFSLCANSMDCLSLGGEEPEDGSSFAMYHADWSNPSLFPAGREESPRKASALAVGSAPSLAGALGLCAPSLAAAASAATLGTAVLAEPLGAASPRREAIPLVEMPQEEAGADSEVDHERSLLLAAISGLSAAADAALRRAEAAEAALQSRAEEDPDSKAARLRLEARIRDSVLAEVKDVVRAAAEEATEELRAAAEEIRRLRADAPSHEGRARASAAEAVSEMRSMVEELRRLRGAGSLPSEVGCEVEEETTAPAASERPWTGCGTSTGPTSGNSSPTQQLDLQRALAPEGLSGDEAIYPEESRVLAAPPDELDQSGGGEDDAVARPRRYNEAEPLRVRDVVSKLERQREQSAVRAVRLNASASTAAINRGGWVEQPAAPAPPRQAEPPRPATILTGVTLMPTPVVGLPSPSGPSTPSAPAPPLMMRVGPASSSTPPGSRRGSLIGQRCGEARSYSEMM